MGWKLLAVATLLYTGAAIDYAARGKWSFCLVYIAYAFANVGLILAGEE